MDLLNRFYFYFIGMFLGVIILIISFQFRDQPISFNYFPNSRVINHLSKQNIKISDLAYCKLECYNLDTLFLSRFLLSSKVDFKKSVIQGTDCKEYVLINKNIDVILKDCNDSINLINIISDYKRCPNCN